MALGWDRAVVSSASDLIDVVKHDAALGDPTLLEEIRWERECMLLNLTAAVKAHACGHF